MTANTEAALIGEHIGEVQEQCEEMITDLWGRGKVSAGNVHVGRKQRVKNVEYPSCGEMHTEAPCQDWDEGRDGLRFTLIYTHTHTHTHTPASFGVLCQGQ